MRFVLTPEQMGAADKATIDAGTPAEVLMDRAGHAVARAVLILAGGRYGKKVVVVCGKGNNGGDGFVVARLLKRQGTGVKVLLLFDPSEAKGAAAHHLELARAEGVRVEAFDPNALDRCDVIVDAIFGTGFRGKAEGVAARAIEAVNLSSAKVVAVDIPSGVDGATGNAEGNTVRADVTVTMQFEKLGTVFGEGAKHAGTIEVADIGITLIQQDRSVMIVERPDVAEWLPIREPDSHKRSAGSVAVLAGSNEMRGAALLTVRGAQRMGSGYVTLGSTGSVKAALAEIAPEALAVEVTDSDIIGPKAIDAFSSVIEKSDALAIGPGMGQGAEQRALVVRALTEIPKPIVLDADAINVLSGEPSPLQDRRRRVERDGWEDVLITPHPAELARLLGSETGEIQRDRVAAVSAAVERFGCTVLLKGAPTLVGSPAGIYVTAAGGPELATAGTGDVLTGAIAALSAEAKDLATPAVAAAAASVHGLAGAFAAQGRGTSGVVAWDVAEALPSARHSISRLRADRRPRFKIGDTVSYAGLPEDDEDFPMVGERGTVIDLGPRHDDICVSWERAATMCHGYGDDLRLVDRS